MVAFRVSFPFFSSSPFASNASWFRSASLDHRRAFAQLLRFHLLTFRMDGKFTGFGTARVFPMALPLALCLEPARDSVVVDRQFVVSIGTFSFRLLPSAAFATWYVRALLFPAARLLRCSWMRLSCIFCATFGIVSSSSHGSFHAIDPSHTTRSHACMSWC